jgi:hypothetical protein
MMGRIIDEILFYNTNIIPSDDVMPDRSKERGQTILI